MLRLPLLVSLLIATALAGGLTVYDQMTSRSDLSEFRALLEANNLDTGLSNTLSGKWLVLAPNNSVVTAANIMANETTTPAVAALVAYHIHEGTLASPQLTTATLTNDFVVEPTDQSTFKRFNRYNGTIYVNGRVAISQEPDEFDIPATNGTSPQRNCHSGHLGIFRCYFRFGALCAKIGSLLLLPIRLIDSRPLLGVIHYIVEELLTPPTDSELRTIGTALNDTYPTLYSLLDAAAVCNHRRCL